MALPPSVGKARKTAIVTIAGVLFMIVALFFAAVTWFGFTSGPIEAARLTFNLTLTVLTLLFGYTGVATMTRWRGWRVWLGAVSWALLVLDCVLFIPAVALRSIADATIHFLLIAVLTILTIVPIFALVGKRMENRANKYDPAGIFE